MSWTKDIPVDNSNTVDTIQPVSSPLWKFADQLDYGSWGYAGGTRVWTKTTIHTIWKYLNEQYRWSDEFTALGPEPGISGPGVIMWRAQDNDSTTWQTGDDSISATTWSRS